MPNLGWAFLCLLLSMPFINAEVDIEELPAVEEISLIPVHKKYIRILRIEWLLAAMFFITAGTSLLLLIPELQNAMAAAVLVGIIILLLGSYLLFQEKSFSFKAHAVREHDVISRKGWLVRSTKICPFNRVQNCTITSGPLERKYGLATLTLYTAGTEGADMRIVGLEKEEAERLRQFILNKINETAEH